MFARIKAPTTREVLLRARLCLNLLGLSGAVGLGALGYFDVHHHSSLEMPLFFVVFGIFIACGAALSNALRCPQCSLPQFYNDGVERNFHVCPRCGADFNAPLRHDLGLPIAYRQPEKLAAMRYREWLAQRDRQQDAP